jgi:phosphatidate cytidylyltransferase
VPALADLASNPAQRPAGGSGASRWSDLRTRVISAAVLVPVALGCLWQGGWAWIVLVAVMTAGLAWEWSRLGGMGVVERVAGGMWLAAGCVALVWLRLDPVVGLVNLLFVLLIVWCSDIGAYMTGRLFGGAKLAPAISPGKTWSGAIGGLASAFVAGDLVAALLSPGDQPGFSWHSAILAVLFGVVAQAGDLAESWVKRQAGVKDSSQLIPGHGGLLDRLDALLAVAPVAAVWAWYLGRGVVLWW